MKKVFLIFLVLVMSSLVNGHPGRTAGDGCHFCRTNCEKWGKTSGTRHSHGSTCDPKLGKLDSIEERVDQISGSDICLAYNRKEYRHWIDADRDCEKTRVEVLKEESKTDAQMNGCKVISGLWEDPYTGNSYTDPSVLDIDHLVPLKEAHESGAYQWDKEMKKQYANDLEYEHSLLAVYRSVNRSKGAKDPAEWLPPNQNFHQEYAKRWINIKLRWNLSIDQKEYEELSRILKDDSDIIFPPIEEEYTCKN